MVGGIQYNHDDNNDDDNDDDDDGEPLVVRAVFLFFCFFRPMYRPVD